MAAISSDNLASRLDSLVGSGKVRAPIDRESGVANAIVEPESAEQVCEIVRMCETDRIALAPLGAARTLASIRRTPVTLGISLARLARIVAYEPNDMTVVAQAGITVGRLNAAMADARQRLPVDPANPDTTTVGAMVAASHAGPLRLSEGTSRDLLIGVRFVGHGGRLIHGGGRVVKNVAGYDLMKLMGGSFGTLGIMTETTFKVRPIPAEYCLAIVPFADVSQAFAAAYILNDALPLSNLDIVSPAFASRFNQPGDFLLFAGFSGNAMEIGYQAQKIRELLFDRGDIFDDNAATNHYEMLRDLDFHSAALSAQIAVPPARLPQALESCGAQFRAHAGSGVAQIVADPPQTAESAAMTVRKWREIAHSLAGNLRTLSVSPAIRDAVEVFDTPNDGALALMRRLKASFDPAGIFNPGCFVGGI